MNIKQMEIKDIKQDNVAIMSSLTKCEQFLAAMITRKPGRTDLQLVQIGDSATYAVLYV